MMKATEKAGPMAVILLLVMVAVNLLPPLITPVYGVTPPGKDQAQTVSSFVELKTAIEAGQPVVLTADLTASSNVGTSAKPIDRDITIYGGGHTLKMGSYQFLLTGSHDLYLSDLVIDTEAKNSTQRYGLFCLYGGSATASRYVWETAFHNLTFRGSALLGTYNTDDYTSTTRMFQSAIFTGDTNISITSAFASYNGVVYVRNVSISDTFVMVDNISGSNTGATNPTYQHYFKSPGTGGVDSEPNNNVARGRFQVNAGAKVTLARSPGRGGDGEESAYYRSLIFGYADHYFGEGAEFYAKAGTNRYAGSGLEHRSAVIRSNNATSFIVDKGAQVKLETDLYNDTAGAASKGCYGYTALALKKTKELEILVEEGAVLNLYADGRSSSSGTRAKAPVVIWGSGSSATTVKGSLKVYSENGNGWYYGYDTSKAGKAQFVVEGTGNVDIRANNQNVKGADEYAAFEAYGKYDVEIIVRDGGKMSVYSNGYRGMSLAGAEGYNQKRILVTGAGSELDLRGVHWAIAAETQPILNIEANRGGKINLVSTGDVGDGYGSGGNAPSTVYSVGPTTYTVDGQGSEINLYHNGGAYSAIFHDGYGPLKINVVNGGVMDVYNRNSGTDNAARRAAITAQSTKSGSYGSYDNEIVVTGAGSSLTVVNENPNTHSDTGLYPTGAVSFNESARGNIRVTDGGSFYATSASPAPTIHLFEGKVILDNPGEFDIRNNALAAKTGSEFSTKGQAIYNERKSNGKTYATALEVKNSDIAVWSLLENNVGFGDEQVDNRWVDVSFTATNKNAVTLAKDGLGGDTKLALNQFDLSSYGRLSGSGKKDYHLVTYYPNSGTGGPFVEEWVSGTRYTVVNNEVAGMFKEGFELTGWNTAADGTGDTYEPGDSFVLTEDLELHAQWRFLSDVRLMVTYLGGSGNGSKLDPGLIPGEPYEILAAQETGVYKTNFDFTEWNTAADGSGVSYQPGDKIEALTENLTLYAQWEYNNKSFFTITYDGREGSVYQDELLVYGQEYTIKSGEQAGMTYPGVTVGSWQGSDGIHYEIGDTITIDNSLILYANWVLTR